MSINSGKLRLLIHKDNIIISNYKYKINELGFIMGLDLSKLTIIKHSPDPLAKANQSNIEKIENDKSIDAPLSLQDQLVETYQDVRGGRLNTNDFKRKMIKMDKTLINDVNPESKDQVLFVLLQTLKWYIQLKILISTGLKAENLSETLSERLPKEYSKLKDEKLISLIKVLDNPSLNTLGFFAQNINPKDSSTIIRNLLHIFISDDPIHPVYKINSKMVTYLANSRPTFLKEITVLFDLYSKVYDQFSKDLLEGLPLKNVSDIQPRFEMINRHILSSNLSSRVNYDLDLNTIGVNDVISDPTLFNTSNLGLSKRLTNLNDWLMNGIIHTQSSINRLFGLKPITKEGKSKLLYDYSSQPANTKYELWQILQDTKSFLESLKGLTDGSAFITGMQSLELLDTLDVNY